MPDMLLMSEQCFLDFAKQDSEKLDTKNKLSDFLCLWSDLHEFVDEIFNYLQQSSPHSQELPIKAQRKSILKAVQASKKIKFIDNPVIA